LFGNDTLKLLKDEVNKIDYDRYIKQLKFNESKSSETLYIYEAPNMILANHIKTKFSKKILHLVEVHTGIRPEIQFNVISKNSSSEQSTKVIQSRTNKKQTMLDPTHKFDNFVVGPSNQFAFTACESVSRKPGEKFNPLFVYGSTGLGKTHLLHAIGNFNINLGKSVIYITSEKLMNEYTSHLSNNTMDKFREKYRNCDILLVDDIQFLSGKKNYQEEFFHTFNELYEKQKQIVLSADKVPKQIPDLEERLKSRFEWGLTANIQPPELETKIAIIKKKCELEGIVLRNDVISYIATNLDTSIREIEGILLVLNTHANMLNQEINLELAQNVLKDHLKEKKENVTLDDIIESVSIELNVKPSEIKSKSRSKNIANARRVVIYLARTLTPNSMPSLAQFFGMKDHSAVSKAMKKVEEDIKENDNYKMLITELKNKITTKG
jgi:chromosomal replication initiator protein